MSSELTSLLSAVCENRATADDLARLAELLRDDPAARDEYLRYIDLHAALSDEALPAVESDIIDYGPEAATPAQNNNRRAYAKWLFAIVASLAVFAGVALLVSRKPGEKIADLPAANFVLLPPVATMLLSDNCSWTGAELAEGQRLNPGRFDLESGTAVLRFDGGAELILSGPVAVDLQTPGSVLVHRGDVVVLATGGAEGFVVSTPTSRVVDLGTEFAVKVARGGETEVHVLDGEVSYRGINQADELSNILRAGEGVAIDENGQPRAVPMNSPRFSEFVNRINPGSRADLLTAYEGFNYSPGSLPLEQSMVGKGWMGPWRKRLSAEGGKPEKTPDRLQIVHGEMGVSWPVPGGRLGMLKLLPDVSTYVRDLEHTIDLNRDGVTYISFMHRQIETPTATSRESSFFLTLADSDDLVRNITLGYGNNLLPVIQSTGGAKFTSPVPMHGDGATLWIAKIIASKSGEDEIYLRVYSRADTLDYAEPAIWHVVTQNVNLTGGFDRVVLRVKGEHSQLIDEIRIGPTWRSVAPITNRESN